MSAGASPAAQPSPPDAGTVRLSTPSNGGLYHGVYPGSANGQEDGVQEADVASYEQTVGRKVAWVYFSDEWSHGRAFPLAQATWIRNRGSVPFIRLMLRSSTAQYVAEPLFTLDAISRGDFDADLLAWGKAAASFGSPVVVEYGTEVNGEWFSWSGYWNGGAGVGPAKFVAAYRHIIQQVRAAGATNVTWAFHVNDVGEPVADWNTPAQYYPGDDVIDWVGFSIYGSATPMDTRCDDFTSELDTLVSQTLATVTTHKPLFVFEMGTSGGNAGCPAAPWADKALQALLSGRWPQVAGFAWWNERWSNDSNPADDSDLRVQTVQGLGTVFQSDLTGTFASKVVDRPVLTP